MKTTPKESGKEEADFFHSPAPFLPCAPSSACWLLSLALPLVLAAPLPARTVKLTAEDCDQVAALSALAPRVSWAIPTQAPGVYNSQSLIYWTNNKGALLLRFPFTELIPRDQRIIKAELTIVPAYVAQAPQLDMRRVLAEWGTGVCHQYRMVHPHKVAWAEPGCRGISTDRANKISAVCKFAKLAEQTVEVTEDVELWYTGAVPNRGWILTLENGIAYLPSPYGTIGGSGKQWKLMITYEPR